jgi:hypothetical protein
LPGLFEQLPFIGTADVVGGTGRFEGASGTIYYTDGVYALLSFDLVEGNIIRNFFGYQRAKYEGIINLKDK